MTRTNIRGFTLIESMVALAVLGILAVVAMPGMQKVVAKQRMRSASYDVVSDLTLARSEALKRGVRVTACVSSDGLHCLASGEWTQGWMLFEDADGNALRSDTEALIGVHAAMPEGLQATGNGTMAHYVSYGPNGRSLTVTGAYQFATITLCRTSTQVNAGWKLVVNAVGKARLEAATLVSCS